MQQLHQRRTQFEKIRNDVEYLFQQVHEIEFIKTSMKHISTRNDRITIIFASLNFAQLIIQLTSLKLYNIFDCYQLSKKCNNCTKFEVRRKSNRDV